MSGVTPEQARIGIPITALQRLRLFSPEEWEQFVFEWAHSLDTYDRVYWRGGPGDQGIDVIAFLAQPGTQADWDLYQCKRYGHPIRPGDIWCEIGKLCYYTKIGSYTAPRKYYLAAPEGTGTKLMKMLQDPKGLAASLKEAWPEHCAKAISKGLTVPLADIEDHIDKFDFSIIEPVNQLDMVTGHSKTRWHVARFGGGLPARPDPQAPPAGLAMSEARYIHQLTAAYSDRLKKPLAVGEPIPDSRLAKHFRRSRICFYSAESLRTFSRDTLPSGEFERLQDEFLEGVADTVELDYPDAYLRVVETVKTAGGLHITDHPLVERMRPNDRVGICHQLVNDDRIRWVDED